MLQDIQKQTCKAIVNLFETGSPRGEYSRVTSHRDDLGGLTYGCSQTTLASGNLYLLVLDYCAREDARHAESLSAYLPRLKARDAALNTDGELHALLTRAGDDPVMQDTQDRFFDEVFWQPAERHARHLGIESALGHCVIYDSQIHGSLRRIMQKTDAEFGSCRDRGETAWVSRYVDTRRDWLLNHRNPLLPRTVYRMDTFRELIAQQRWNLALPLRIRSVWLEEDMLSRPTGTVRGSAEDAVVLSRDDRGPGVEALQRTLNRQGESLQIDGIFGPATEAAVRRFQQRNHLTVDGIVGPATRVALLIDQDR